MKAEKYDILVKLFLDTMRDMINEIEKHSEKKGYIAPHYNFPIRRENKDNGMPSFSKSMFNHEPINYTNVFTSNPKQTDKVQLESIDTYCELINFILMDSEMQEENYYLKSLVGDFKESVMKNTILGLVDNYMHIYYVKGQQFDDIKAKKLLLKIFNRMFNKNLEITILVPILLLDFEAEEYKFSETMRIRRMTDEEQLARYSIGDYDSTRELFIVEEALYVLELGIYTIENNNFMASSILYQHNAYPVQKIDEWFAALRVVTGFETGYAQILAIPNGWCDMEKANLLPMKGAKVYKFNYNFVKDAKWNTNINIVSKEQLDITKRVFEYINEMASKSVKIAVNRLNRCFLREDVDDATIDAVIAIEALLTENDLGEITYKVSNRASAVISTVCKSKYSAVEIRDAMKKIYAYRSKVVHGSDMKEKDINIKVNNKITMNATDLAIEFLRYIILAITENNELAKANKIDEYMCTRFDSSNS